MTNYICYLTTTELLIFIGGFLLGLALGYYYGRIDEAEEQKVRGAFHPQQPTSRPNGSTPPPPPTGKERGHHG